MQLFYAPDFVPPQYTLSEEESRHVVKVMRMNCGDTVFITDGRGTLFECRITEAVSYTHLTLPTNSLV